MADPRVLVVDDTAANRRLVAALLTAEGFTVEGAEGGVQALEMVEKSPPDLILLDLQMPGMNGLTVLRELRKQWPDLPVVMQTAHGDIPSAVEAIKLGADDFLTRPTANDKLVLTVRHALERHQLRNEVHVLRKRLAAEHPLVQKMGPSPKVAEVVRQVAEVAESPLTVLIQGETGTGKELVARAIHAGSQRSARPFIAVDCGAIPETLLESELFGHERGAFTGADRRRAGLLELAEGGSLFLDEIGNLPAAMQAKMLRVMQEREVRPLGAAKAIRIDVRFIAATHARLAAEVAAGKFREDLFFRLAEYTIVLPPLRTRLGDVRPLAMRFLDEAASELRRPVAGLSDEALARLTAHAWPGNVRELRNVVRQVSLQSEAHTITHTDIDRLLTRAQSRPGPGEQVTEITSAPEGASLKEIADHAASEAERQAIVRAMRATGGNKSQAARRLKVDYKTLHLKIRRYGLAVGKGDQDAAGAGGDDDEGAGS